MPDPKLLWFHSTERKSVYVEGQNFVPDAEGYVAVPENLGSYIMVIPGFTYVGPVTSVYSHVQPNESSSRFLVG
jgi:hypothetical protein